MKEHSPNIFNNDEFLKVEPVVLENIRWAFKRVIPDVILANLRLETQRDDIYRGLAVQFMADLMAEKKEDKIEVVAYFQQYASLADHIKDIIKKCEYIPEMIRDKLYVNTKTIDRKMVIDLAQYIIYPSLEPTDKRYMSVYKCNYNIREVK